MPQIEDCANIDKKISQGVKDLVIDSQMTQVDLANRMDIAKPTLSQMLSGVKPLPIERFFEIVGIINPARKPVNEVFALYQKKYSIPAAAIALLDGGWILQRYSELLKIPETELSEFNQKELEVIRGWLDIESECTSTKQDISRKRLHELVDCLTDSDCELAEALLERLVKVHRSK